MKVPCRGKLINNTKLFKKSFCMYTQIKIYFSSDPDDEFLSSISPQRRSFFLGVDGRITINQTHYYCYYLIDNDAFASFFEDELSPLASAQVAAPHDESE